MLKMRSIAFSAIVLLLIWVDCLSFNIGGFWGIARGAWRVCCVALPLVMLSRLKFSLVLAFWAFGCILDRVNRFRAIVGRF
jgi:hypothetical protein